MFGIMRPESACAHKQDPNYRYHRMHYCGVCKAMGKEYGHKSRLLLNYDTVFLAEMLSELSSEDLSHWGTAYQAINRCMTMPKSQATPIPLQYAADANLLLSELKVEDHLQDTGRWSWRFASWWYDSAFAKAGQQMESKWSLPSAQLHQWADLQLERESNAPMAEDTLQSYLQGLAEPTAQITALVFAHGVAAIGRADLSASAAQLGYRFGELAYWLDAFEDVERDAFSKQFNPLLAYFEAQTTLKEADRAQAREAILALQEMIIAEMAALPISNLRQEIFAGRLRSKLALTLYKDPVIPMRWSARIAKRWQQARSYAQELTCDSSSWTKPLRYQLISIAVFMAPRTPEFMGLTQKEVLVFSWAAFLSAFFAALGLGIAWGRGQQQKKKKKEKRRLRKRLRRFARKLRSAFKKRDCADCLTVCGVACLGACLEGCCEGCASSCCNSCCDSCFSGDCGENAWIWLLLLGILVIGLSVLLIILI